MGEQCLQSSNARVKFSPSPTFSLELLHRGSPEPKWWLVTLPVLLMLCHFEITPKTFGGMLLIAMLQREISELCKEGKCACCRLDDLLLLLSAQPLHPDGISGVCSEEREAACKTALRMCGFQWKGWGRGKGWS